MAANSGKYGQVDFGGSSYGEANNWTMEKTSDVTQYGKFGGGGRKSAVSGQGSARGTISGKYDFADPIEDVVDIGDSVTLYLYQRTTTGGGESKYTVPAIVESVNITVDGDTGAPVEWTLNWVSDGAWTDPS